MILLKNSIVYQSNFDPMRDLKKWNQDWHNIVKWIDWLLN